MTSEADLREVSTEGGVLRYYDVGDGPPLLMLHGSGPGVTGWRNFGGNLESFAPHFRCLVLELPGFGVSAPSDQHPMLAATPAVIGFLDALDLTSVDVIGNSMGGMIAAQVAISQPDRVRRLVTVGGIGRNILSPAPGEGIKLLQDFTEEPTRERLEAWLQSMVFDPATVTDQMREERWAQATEPATLESARMMYSRAAMEFGLAMQDKSDARPLWANLHRIRAKTLITWGRDDRVSPIDMALLPMRTIPDVEVHVFPDCGHWVMIEQRAAWERVVHRVPDPSVSAPGRMAGRVGIISGGARGMGAETARVLVREGARVVIGDVLLDVGAATAAELGDAARFVPLDVTEADDWTRAVATAVDDFGHLDLLVNNAGVTTRRRIQRFPLEDFQRIVGINLTGAFLGMRASTEAMIAAGGGAIVNVSSIQGIHGTPYNHAYVASKFGLRGLTKSAALELAPHGIRVNSIHPGLIRTPMVEHMPDDLIPIPLGRPGQPADVANLILFLASDEASYATGAEFVLDGGSLQNMRRDP